MSVSTVKWDAVQRDLERAQHKIVWRPYAAPEILDPEFSVFHEGEIQPPWDVPDKLILQSAITRAFFSRQASPNQPITLAEILASARECARAGASAIHLHVRDDSGYNVLSVERFRDVVLPLRDEFPGIWIDGCYVCALESEWDQMKHALDEGLLDAVPVNTTAVYQGDALFAKPVPVLLEKTRLIVDSGARPIVAVYTDADVANAQRYLFRSGLLEPGQMWCILPALPGCSPMENPAQMISGLTRIVELIKDTDPGATMIVCAAGRASTYLVTVAAAMGLHVRVGMEDTVWRWPHRREKLESNLQALETAKAMAAVLGREVASYADFRQITGQPSFQPS